MAAIATGVAAGGGGRQNSLVIVDAHAVHEIGRTRVPHLYNEYVIVTAARLTLTAEESGWKIEATNAGRWQRENFSAEKVEARRLAIQQRGRQQ